MKGEIDKDFYCSADSLNGNKRCSIKQMVTNDNHCSSLCKNYHRKHPTPEQYKEEYGEEYPDDGAVYRLSPKGNWQIMSYSSAKLSLTIIVCACTPFGKPLGNWRPKE